MKPNEKKTRSMKGGWNLYFYGGEKRYRKYVKSNFTIRQLHLPSGCAVSVWELLQGSKIIATARTRKELKDLAESMM